MPVMFGLRCSSFSQVACGSRLRGSASALFPLVCSLQGTNNPKILGEAHVILYYVSNRSYPENTKVTVYGALGGRTMQNLSHYLTLSNTIYSSSYVNALCVRDFKCSCPRELRLAFHTH